MSEEALHHLQPYDAMGSHMPGFMMTKYERLDYCTSARDSVSPDGGQTSIPITAYAVQRYISEGGKIGAPLIEIPTTEDVAYIRDEKRAEIVNEALDMFRRAERDAVVTEARNANPELFSHPDPMGEALERQRAANRQLCAPASAIPAEIAALLEDGETLTKEVRRKLTERLNVELAELINLRGLAGEDRKREAEIQKLLGLFARLGEI